MKIFGLMEAFVRMLHELDCCWKICVARGKNVNLADLACGEEEFMLHADRRQLMLDERPIQNGHNHISEHGTRSTTKLRYYIQPDCNVVLTLANLNREAKADL